ncbi:hypothetical protein [Roseiconus lacunae]|uniref:Peptidase S9 prolyl oligopeptidase catalytic domain-containing protein n=1 Tax=Roseiconus lacunae TaxID=2605694 RepID=A0ABT7PQK2_9BACT|nr:hypothetical protein [Roseiconus lacunae]MDM4018794.1 hypothetical protein [Roseiconus lacunae]
MKQPSNFRWAVANAALLLALMLEPGHAAAQETGANGQLDFAHELTVAKSGFDGTMCWVHARAGIVPGNVMRPEAEEPKVVMTAQKLLLSGSDVFYRLHQTTSRDGGQTWSDWVPIDSFARETYTGPDDPLPTGADLGLKLLQPGDETTVCDFSPQWHAASQRLLGIGQTVWYRNNRVMHVRPRGIAYAVFDHRRNRWQRWKTVRLPDEPRFVSAGSGSQQRVDLVGGDVLIPFYFKRPEDKQFSSAVCRCRFDGETLHFVDVGNALTLPIKRGLYEPSITHFKDRFYLTLRNDDGAYVSVSEDGLQYSEPRHWKFDDGTKLLNYNTQQHWVTHSDGLYLVYTRRGADNDHVFRHRAPLFIARVDPKSLTLLKGTEQIIVPQRGARLGNFGVVDVSADETWVTAAEWMQPLGVEKHGSDNSIFIAKLHWNRPNKHFGQSTPTPLARYADPPAALRDQTGNYRSVLALNDGGTVETADGWLKRRELLRRQWHSLLGQWPPLITTQDIDILATEKLEKCTQSRIRFRWTPTETATGYLLVPNSPGPHPAVVTVFYEPETAIGQGKPNRDFALQLARRGFVTLSIGTTDASLAKTYSIYHPSIENASVQPLSMLAYAAANAWHVLANRPDVDEKRIGIVGHSFGGKWAMFASCLFDRFACAAWSDPGIVFDQRPSVNYWEPWYLGYHPKPWRDRGVPTAENPARGLYPQLLDQGRDLHELHALMAPRPFLVSGGSEDPITRWQALNRTREVYRLLGATGRVMMTNRPDHSPNDDSNEVIYRFFENYLKQTQTP